MSDDDNVSKTIIGAALDADVELTDNVVRLAREVERKKRQSFIGRAKAYILENTPSLLLWLGILIAAVTAAILEHFGVTL